MNETWSEIGCFQKKQILVYYGVQMCVYTSTCVCVCESAKVWEGKKKSSRDLGETMKKTKQILKR